MQYVLLTNKEVAEELGSLNLHQNYHRTVTRVVPVLTWPRVPMVLRLGDKLI